MATKLYLHNATSGVSGTLPSSEQSTLTADANLFTGEDGTANRTMDTTIGVSQANLTNSSTNDTNAHNYYIARWVSPLIYQGSISANTYTLEYGAKEANAAANFPRNGAGALHVNCYVWKPSTGTKVGTVIDGNSAADFEEAGTSQSVISGTFSGAAVTGITPGDAVLVVELWAIVTQGNGTSRTQDIYYDGTTEGSTSNMAARLETPENLQFSETPINMTIIGGAFTGVSTANTTQYLPISGSWGSNNFTTTEAEVQIPIRKAGVLSRLAVRITAYSVSAGGSTYTVRKNGVDTGLVLTFGATGYHEDLVNTVSVAAGDKISIKTVPGGATGTFTHKTCRLHFTADDGSTTGILACSEPNSIVNNSATRFYPIVGRMTNTTTEANCKVEQRVVGTYAKLAVYVQSNARTTSTTFKSRINGADGNLSVTYAAGETGLKEDTSNSDTVAVGDDYAFAITTGSGASESIVPFFMKVEFTSNEWKGILSTGNTGSSNQQNANETREMALIGAANPLVTTTEYRAKIRNSKLILSDLHVYVMTNTVTANSTANVLVNGVASALTCTITASTIGMYVDTTHLVEVGSNDEVTVQIVAGATGTVLGTSSAQVYYHTGRLSKENKFLYDMIGRISKENKFLYDIFARISKEAKFLYDILARISKENKFLYDIIGRISKESKFLYDIVGRISKECKFLYDIVGRISKENIFLYDILASLERVSKEIIFLYDMIGRTSKENKFLYDIIERISKESKFLYDIFGRISNEIKFLYDIIGRISKENKFLYDIVGRISNEIKYLYDIVGRTSKEFISKYDIFGRISNEIKFLYDIIGRISKETKFLYDIFEEGLTRISKEAIFLYDMFGRISKENKFLYDIFARISKQFIALYDIFGRISKENKLLYDIFGRVSKESKFLYDIFQRVSKETKYLYDIFGRISKESKFLYDIFERISKQVIFLYDIFERISKQSIFKYDIFERISKQFTALYDIIGRVSKENIFLYDILTEFTRISKEVSFLYSIFEYKVGKRVGANIWQKQYKEQVEKWKPDWIAMYNKKLDKMRESWKGKWK